MSVLFYSLSATLITNTSVLTQTIYQACLAMIKELNGIGSGFIVIDFKIKHSGSTVNEMEREIIRVVRTLTWLGLDDLTDSISTSMPNANRSLKMTIVRGLRIISSNA
jgi:hypothetical protein